MTCFKNQKCRDDYSEFLELMTFLVNTRLCWLLFRYPGAFHHSRWMSKDIFYLKIYEFKINFTAHLQKNYRSEILCFFFGVHSQTKAWFRLQKWLVKYSDADIFHLGLHKLYGHLWYLSSELVWSLIKKTKGEYRKGYEEKCANDMKINNCNTICVIKFQRFILSYCTCFSVLYYLQLYKRIT